MTVLVHRPEYTHIHFPDLMSEDGVKGRLVPVAEVFDVMDETHHRPVRFVTAEGVAAAKVITPDFGGPWLKLETGFAWVMETMWRNHKPSSLIAGNYSPFVVVERAQ